jgi:sulfite reductase (NADPH) hemoprotein beta-component
MSDVDVLQLVTANRLRDGVPVYRTGEGWSPAVDDACLVAEPEAEAFLAAAQAGPKPLPVVAPYLAAAVAERGKVRPLALRERIRAFGPTI